MAEPRGAEWLKSPPSDTPLARLAARLGPVGAGALPKPAVPTAWDPSAVWAQALAGNAAATDRWRLWRDAAFWAGGPPSRSPTKLLKDLQNADHLHLELGWYFNQPAAQLAPGLGSLLAQCPWTLPLREPRSLGDRAAQEGATPRELLQYWGAGSASPEHMAAALAAFTHRLCTDAGANLTEGEVDELLVRALRGEEDPTPQWRRPEEGVPPAERAAVKAVLEAVPPSLWPLLRETRALLAEWREQRAEKLGPDTASKLSGLTGYAFSDRLLAFAEELAEEPYAFLHELWGGEADGARKLTKHETHARNTLTRVGFFMNYAGSIYDCIVVLGARGQQVDVAPLERGQVLRSTGADRVVLLLGELELLIRLGDGGHESRDPSIRLFVRPRPAAQGTTPSSPARLSVQTWQRRIKTIDDGDDPPGERSDHHLAARGQGWQGALLEALAKLGILPDEGLSHVRGTPNWHQRKTLARIKELRSRT